MNNERTGRLGQTKVYVGKFYRIFINEKDWKVLAFAAAISLVLSLVLRGSIFILKEGTRSGFFAIISSCVWIGIFNSIQNICRERAIIKREHRTGLHISSYVAAHMIFQAGVCVIQALIMTLVYGFILPFPTYGLVFGSFFVDLFVTFFLVIYSSDVLGLAISALVKNTTAAMTVMPFVLIVQLIFSGTIFPLTGAAKSLSDLTIAKWGQRVLCVEANLNEIPSQMARDEISIIQSIDSVKKLKESLPKEYQDKFDQTITNEVNVAISRYTYRSIYEHRRSNVVSRWMYLVIFTLAYAFICVISLEFIDRDQR